MLQIKLLRAASTPPKRAHASDAGLDLYYSGKPLLIKEEETVKVPAGFAMSIPPGNVAKIYSRSGLGSQGITLANGVGIIDSDYRGEVMVALVNRSGKNFTLKSGDRFAQMVIQPCWLWSTDIVDTLPDTQRGAKGFGATGK